MAGRSIIRFISLAALIVSVALALWLLGVDRGWIVAGILAMWAVASVLEWLAWRHGDDPWRGSRTAPPEPAVGVPPPRRVQQSDQVVEARDDVPGDEAPPVPTPEPAPPSEPLPSPEPGRPPQAPPQPVPEPTPQPEPFPPLEPDPVPPVEPDPVPPVEPDPEPQPEPERPQLVALPTPPEPEPAPPPKEAPPPAPVRVVQMPARGPRQWNVWELDRLVRANPGGAEAEERSLLLLHLRQHADANGTLPVEFDPLIRETFGMLLFRVEEA